MRPKFNALEIKKRNLAEDIENAKPGDIIIWHVPREKKKCPMCKGKGKLKTHIKGETVTCSTCLGTGYGRKTEFKHMY